LTILVLQVQPLVLELFNNGLDSLSLCMKFDDFDVPAEETSYICKGFRFPASKAFHITKFTPIKSNQQVLHHMILYSTTDWLGDDYFPCPSMPSGSQPLFAWAVGGGTFEPPADVGFPVGKDRVVYAALQIHYNNIGAVEGLVDSSGVTMCVLYTWFQN
jgi:hypothetical protein